MARGVPRPGHPRGGGVRFRFLGILLACLAVAAVCPAEEPGERGAVGPGFVAGWGMPVGRVLAVDGEGIVFHRGETIGYRLWEDAPLYSGDLLAAGDRGGITVLLADDTLLSLGGETRLRLHRIRHRPDAGFRSIFLGLPSGEVRFRVPAPATPADDRFRVKTPTALIGTSGAAFLVGASEAATTVVPLARKAVTVASLAGGRRYAASPGHEMTVPADGPPALRPLTEPELTSLRVPFPPMEEIGEPIAGEPIRFRQSEFIPVAPVEAPEPFPRMAERDRFAEVRDDLIGGLPW